MTDIKRICILGGTGFVGHALACRLATAGYQLRIPTRNREAHRYDLIVLPGLELIEADIHHPPILDELLAGCDAVIHLVGILNEHGHNGSGFRRVHVDLTRHLVESCQRAGVMRLLYMSALNADSQRGRSHYLRTKGQAETIVTQAPHLRTTIFRPSVIFGAGDSFLNRFASLLAITPILPLAVANTRFAPVFVRDAAEAMARCVSLPASHGQCYELCGPRVYTLLELVGIVARLTRRRRFIVPLSRRLSYLQAKIAEYLPGKPFSVDNYLSALADSVCDGGTAGLSTLGITPTALETIAPAYLSCEADDGA